MTVAVIRRPSVAGYFYPADPDELRQAAAALIQEGSAPRPAKALVLPHGSFSYSGKVAGAAIAQTVIPRQCIIIGASHTGSWVRWSILDAGAYRTPLGEVPVNEGITARLCERCPWLTPDPASQMGEHAIEVLLPLIQCRVGEGLNLVPIIVGAAEAGEAAILADAIAEAIQASSQPALVIASADVCQFEPLARVPSLLEAFAASVARLRPESLEADWRAEGLMPCGGAAVETAVRAALRLGASTAVLAASGSSAQGGGDPGSATGYAGIVIR